VLERRQGQSSTEVRTLKKGLQADWQERQHQPLTPLEKATRDVFRRTFDRSPTHVELTHSTPMVRRDFGPQGGHVLPCTENNMARMRVCGALTKAQYARWVQYERIPDHVDPDHPTLAPEVQQERDRSMLGQHALASLQLSPLVFPSLLRRA